MHQQGIALSGSSLHYISLQTSMACHARGAQDFNRRLRQEQDDAYQASLAEDREREAQRAQQREAKAAAERAAQEAAAQARCGVSWAVVPACMHAVHPSEVRHTMPALPFSIESVASGMAQQIDVFAGVTCNGCAIKHHRLRC